MNFSETIHRRRHVGGFFTQLFIKIPFLMSSNDAMKKKFATNEKHCKLHVNRVTRGFKCFPRRITRLKARSDLSSIYRRDSYFKRISHPSFGWKNPTTRAYIDERTFRRFFRLFNRYSEKVLRTCGNIFFSYDSNLI